MKRNSFILFGLVVCLIMVGCTTPSQDNPFGISDPNQVQGWINYGVLVGQGTTAAGAATGNPYLLAWGAGLVAGGGVLTTILFGTKKKKEGEDSGTT